MNKSLIESTNYCNNVKISYEIMGEIPMMYDSIYNGYLLCFVNSNSNDLKAGIIEFMYTGLDNTTYIQKHMSFRSFAPQLIQNTFDKSIYSFKPSYGFNYNVHINLKIPINGLLSDSFILITEQFINGELLNDKTLFIKELYFLFIFILIFICIICVYNCFCNYPRRILSDDFNELEV